MVSTPSRHFWICLIECGQESVFVKSILKVKLTTVNPLSAPLPKRTDIVVHLLTGSLE